MCLGNERAAGNEVDSSDSLAKRLWRIDEIQKVSCSAAESVTLTLFSCTYPTCLCSRLLTAHILRVAKTVSEIRFQILGIINIIRIHPLRTTNVHIKEHESTGRI